MTSKIKNKPISKPPISVTQPEGRYELLSVSEIDFSPLNYRKHYSEIGIEELADSIVLFGIIENLTVRPMPSGRFELVTGERRLRAAAMVSLLKVPVTIKDLNDDEVREIQLVENLHGEDVHPIHEALAIGYMQQNRKTVDEIAARLGKSKTFVYARIKLASLIPEIQEIFLSDSFNLTEALQICVLSTSAQQAFFSQYCANWQKEKHFQVGNLKYVLSQFKYGLNSAPFDRKDKQLLPEVGACSKCPFNTATMKTLFPDEAKEAVCTNGECFERKCNAHHAIKLARIFETEKPNALLYSWDIPEMLELACKVIAGANDLPKYDRCKMSICSDPEIPEKDDFMIEGEDEEAEPEFDEGGYNQAMEEYISETDRYKSAVLQGEVLKGLHFSDSECKVVFFIPRPAQSENLLPKVTAKEVQSALKAGTATPDLLRAEIARLSDREKRLKELDREKVQISVHEKFQTEMSSMTSEPTVADWAAARLIIFQSLDYSSRNEVLQKLWMQNDKFDHKNAESLYLGLQELSNSQFGYLVRAAIVSNTDSKSPRTEAGYFLYKIGEMAGTDIQSIEISQREKTEKREAVLEDRLNNLRNRMDKLNPEG